MAATRRGAAKRAGRRRAGLPLLVAGLGTLAARKAGAQSYIDSRLLLYQESGGRTQVVDPLFFLRQDFGETAGQLDLTVGYDVVSGASPTGGYPTLDVTTSASGGTSASGQVPLVSYSDRRASLAAAYRRRFGSHLPEVDLSYAKENDYTARSLGISDAWTMLEGRGTLHLGLSLSDDVVAPVGRDVKLPKRGNGYSLGWTWVLGERDVVDVSASLMALSGYLDDPYKVVPIGAPEDGTTAPEHRPDSRSRFALVARYGHHYRWDGAIKTSYRFYSDDWGVRAHTVELVYDQRLGSDWIVSPQLRLYVQSAASFYGSLFVEPQQFMSADYRLSAFHSVLAGLKVSRKLYGGLEVYGEVTFQTQRGSDRITLTKATMGLRDDEGEGGSASVSAADLNVATVVFGFTRRF